MNDLGYLWADENRHLSRAMKMIRKAVEAEPDNGAYRDSLGWVLYRLGRYEEAIAELEKAAERQPDGVIFDHLGDAYRKSASTGKSPQCLAPRRRIVPQGKRRRKAKEIEKKSAG